MSGDTALIPVVADQKSALALDIAFSPDGRELFFESAGQLKAVDVSAGASFTPGNPRTLFSLPGYRRARNRQQYDVSPDGTRFVMIREGNRTTDCEWHMRRTGSPSFAQR